MLVTSMFFIFEYKIFKLSHVSSWDHISHSCDPDSLRILLFYLLFNFFFIYIHQNQSFHKHSKEPFHPFQEPVEARKNV
jgi:hypothetical protein